MSSHPAMLMQLGTIFPMMRKAHDCGLAVATARCSLFAVRARDTTVEAFWAPRYPSVWVPVLPLSFQAFWPLAVLP